MSPSRWREIERVFQEAIERAPDERDEFLAAACASDHQLRGEVESLLKQRSSGKGILDKPVWNILGETAQNDRFETAISPGTQLGPYRMEALLGAGGMGKVFRATDTRLGRIVAIKFLSAASQSDPAGKKRLLQEARAASALNHPNIVAVYDICNERGIDFLVMQYVPGNSLKELLRPDGLPLVDSLLYVAQIADALAAAHAAGIVHRDIKPANIMITPDKQVKVLDFGIAKLNQAPKENQADTPTQLTLPGTLIGTLAYMSPEQTRGEETDGRSDIFSLCVVLYAAVTGRLPFDGPSTLSLLHAIATTQPPKASSVNKRVPKSLDRILSRGLAKDPAHRLQTAGELADELRKLAASETPRTLPRLGLLTSAGAAVITLACFGWWAWQRSAATPVGTLPLQQITTFVGAEAETSPSGAGSPAISNDGRLLAFIHDSQVWMKLLPSGETRQVTRDPSPKFDPVFSPDGGSIAYSLISREGSWDTWVAPTLGGEPHLLLPNSSGLRWNSPDTILFSEIKSGMHMAVVTANTSRTSSRDIYVPPDIRGMAHRSYAYLPRF